MNFQEAPNTLFGSEVYTLVLENWSTFALAGGMLVVIALVTATRKRVNGGVTRKRRRRYEN